MLNGDIERMLGFYRKAIPALPNRRVDSPDNQLAITEDDRANIDAKFGRPVADAVLRMQQEQHLQGGVNPEAAKSLFPYGLTGPMDEEALVRILVNHVAWHARS